MRLKRLENIKSLQSGTGEVSNYITCCLLMKDRLENIFISGKTDHKGEPSFEELYFNDLYNKLDQFGNLKEIDIRRKATEEIKELEYVVESCKSLKKINYDFRFSNNNNQAITNPSPNDSISMDDISKLTPRFNIGSLDTHLTVSEDCKNLLYIMHKFPRLREISLNIMEENSCKLTYDVLSRLIDFFCRIDDVYATNLTTDNDAISKCFEKLWNPKSNFVVKEIQLDYSNYYSDVNFNIYTDQVQISYPFSGSVWRHRDFLEKNGKFIEKLELSFMEDSFNYTERCVIPEDTFIHTLTHCPNIQSLIFQKLTFEQPTTRLNLDGIKVTTLKSLAFEHCTIGYGVLERFVDCFDEINSLHLAEARLVNGEIRYRGQAGIEIFRFDAPGTKINRVMINYDLPNNEPLYLQLYEKDDLMYYYRHDPSKADFREELSEEEYLNLGTHRYIYICCASKPRVDIE